MTIRILVVDDNRDTLKTYVTTLLRKSIEWSGDLSPLGYSQVEVEEADTISLAIEKMRVKSFEILVVDLKIRGLSGEEMGGLELISESLKLDPFRPIIAITGYGSIQLVRQTLTQGVFDFIEKSDKAVDDLISAIQRAIKYRDEKATRSGNPFRAMSSVEPKIFGGRSAELEFFVQKLDQVIRTGFCEHFLVLGNWGIGKSTLMKEYKKICQIRGHMASVVPLEALQLGETTEKAAYSIVEGIFRGLPYPVNQLKRVLAHLSTIGISIAGTGFRLSKDTSRKETSAEAFLHDTFKNLWQDLEDKTNVLVILLDDLDNFVNVPEIVTTLKQTLSMDSVMKTKILIGLTSTPRNWLQLTSRERYHPLSRYFRAMIELTNLTQDEVTETIVKSLAGTGVSFSSELITKIFGFSAGHPFEMQTLCYHLFSNQSFGKVGIESWDKAMLSSLNDIGNVVFQHWVNEANDEELEVLNIMAHQEAPVSIMLINTLAKESKVKLLPEDISRCLQYLREKMLVKRVKQNTYIITDEMFRNYLCIHSGQ